MGKYPEDPTRLAPQRFRRKEWRAGSPGCKIGPGGSPKGAAAPSLHAALGGPFGPGRAVRPLSYRFSGRTPVGGGGQTALRWRDYANEAVSPPLRWSNPVGCWGARPRFGVSPPQRWKVRDPADPRRKKPGLTTFSAGSRPRRSRPRAPGSAPPGGQAGPPAPGGLVHRGQLPRGVRPDLPHQADSCTGVSSPGGARRTPRTPRTRGTASRHRTAFLSASHRPGGVTVRPIQGGIGGPLGGGPVWPDSATREDRT